MKEKKKIKNKDDEFQIKDLLLIVMINLIKKISLTLTFLEIILRLQIAYYRLNTQQVIIQIY